MAGRRRPAAVTLTGGVPVAFAPVLDRLRRDAASYYGVPSVELTATVSQERPFSHLVRLEACRGSERRPISRLFVKIFKSKGSAEDQARMRARVAQDFETTRRVHQLMLEYADLGAVPPVACYPEHLAIVTEQVDGPTLLEHLLRQASWFSHGQSPALADTMARVGRWVKVFQTLAPGDRHVTVEELTEYVDVRLQRLVRDSGGRFEERDRQRVLLHMHHLGTQIGAEELREVAIHADMALGNVLVAGRRIVVLDFAMAKRGGRLHDLARLFLQLDLLRVKPQIRSSVIRAAQDAMLRGFEPSLSAAQPLFRLHLLLHRVNHFTTLTVNRARPHEAAYNFFVCRQHRNWIEAEVAGPVAAAARQ